MRGEEGKGSLEDDDNDSGNVVDLTALARRNVAREQMHGGGTGLKADKGM
jgi:hypothetical protein